MSSDKAAVALSAALEKFQQAYDDFFTVVDAYPLELYDATGACGDWSARDIIAHMAGWVVEALRRFRRYGRGTSDFIYNTDAFNEVSLWLRRDDDYETVLEELHTRVDELLAFLDQLPEQRHSDDRYAEWLQTLSNDAQRHAADLRQFQQAQQ